MSIQFHNPHIFDAVWMDIKCEYEFDAAYFPASVSRSLAAAPQGTTAYTAPTAVCSESASKLNAGSRTPPHGNSVERLLQISHSPMSFSGRSGVESPTPYEVLLLTRALRSTRQFFLLLSIMLPR